MSTFRHSLSQSQRHRRVVQPLAGDGVPQVVLPGRLVVGLSTGVMEAGRLDHLRADVPGAVRHHLLRDVASRMDDHRESAQ